MKCSLIVFFALATALPPLIGGQSGSVYLVQKQQTFLQTSASAPAPFPLYPFEMSLQGAAATNVVTGAGTVVIAPSSNSNSPGLHASYATQSALDAAFPDGTFTFSGPPAYSVNLTGDLYPAATPAVASGGTWANGVLVIDPAVATTLVFSTFAGYGSTGLLSHMSFQTNAQDGSNTGTSQDLVSAALLGFPVGASPFTSVAFPAGSLKAGVVYQAELDFDTATFVDTTSLSGGALVGLYSKTVGFYIVGKPATAAPAISVNPLSNVAGVTGSAVTIPVSGSGLTGAVNATWFFNGTELSLGIGGHYSTPNGLNLTINGATASDAGKYYAIVVGAGGLAVTNEISLTLAAPVLPQITTQPSSVTAIGGTVVFNVTATGGGLSYQWKFNNANVAGNSTSSRLILSGINSGSAGSYTCVVSNGAGAVTSAAATLTVPPQSPNLNGRLVNESVQSSVPAGTTLTVAFIVGGNGTSPTQTLPVLIRGDGPALAAFGLPGTMPDPAIQVIPQGQPPLYTNDNWGSNLAAVTAADGATGAFPLPAGSLDAALTAGLSGGGYSVALTPNGPGGTAQAEIYDNIPAGTYQVSAPRIVNLSALTVLPAGGTLSAGFFLGGSTSRTLLIRAIGPTLAGLGLTGLMADPVLTLVTTSNGAFVAGNQGWGGDPTLGTIAVQAGGFAFASSTSLDSAVLVTLTPGVGYTAEATSASGAAGEVLIEIYEVP